MTGCKKEATLAYNLLQSSLHPGFLPVLPLPVYRPPGSKDRKKIVSSFSVRENLCEAEILVRAVIFNPSCTFKSPEHLKRGEESLAHPF